MSHLKELNEAISRGTPESCLKALWLATDVLIAGRYTDDQIWIFGEVIGRLSEEIELVARAELARRLARCDHAPIYTINRLASDDSLDVASPVLRYSERVGVATLVASARSKGQEHLLAISLRKSIEEPVTDVLVARGDQRVVNSVTANVGARFSQSGFLRLIKRAENDSILAEHLGRRLDIPRHLFQQLIAKASAEVRRKLEGERFESESQIQNAVVNVTGALHSMFGPASKSYFNAKRVVGAQHQLGELNEARVLEYALARKLDEVIVALSLLCTLPVDVVERALLAPDKEEVLILAKAINLSWATTMAMVFLGSVEHRIVSRDLSAMEREYALLDVATSREVLKTYHLRKASAESGFRKLPQLHAV
jgi:uncharacterized protein (DUF2336 family)